MVAVGEIIGQRAKAEQVFQQIPVRYNQLKEEAAAAASSAKPKVMINTPYADSWVMASTSSYVARLIADAGGDYIYRKNTSNSSMPIDLEEAARLSAEADVWINVGSLTSLSDMRRQFPKFADTPCVVKGEVYNCDKRSEPGRGNDYWESGIVNPDIVLRDLIKIFHPELINEEFVYYRQLK
jgi:iron complex transport system substrate-binding protein